MLIYPGCDQTCATCGLEVVRLFVGIESERRGRTFTFNRNVPCGCVHNVRFTTDDVERPRSLVSAGV